MSELWIVIPNWDKFQHYKDRDPTWVKNYTALLQNDDYLGLAPGTRSILHGLWLVYASAHCQLRLDTASLSRRLALRVTKRQLESLKDAGFIELSASKPLALARSRESTSYLREEKSAGAPAREEPRAAPAPEERKPPATGETVCPRCCIDRRTEQNLRDHLANVHDEYGDNGLVPDEFAEHVRAMSRMRVGE
jgi:hypothetical protein